MFMPVQTADGSSTFYSEAFGEWFHSREGACGEAQKTYVEASQLAERMQQRATAGRNQEPFKILDVCYGLGYNTAAALERVGALAATRLVDEPLAARPPVEIKALEIDIEVARSAIAQGLTQRYPSAVQQVLQELADQGTSEQAGLSAQLLLGDAREQIQLLTAQGWQADVVFLDPFSPPNCPQLWTAEFLQLVAQCLSPVEGVLVTYSCAAAVRTALRLAGLSIGTLQTAARKWPGTLACHATSDLAAALPPLSVQEQEHLLTRAAVPYRDPTLQGTAEEILAHRGQAQAISSLLPTKPWRKRWATHGQRAAQ